MISYNSLRQDCHLR